MRKYLVHSGNQELRRLKEQESKESLPVLHFLHEFCSGIQVLSYIGLFILSRKTYGKLITEMKLTFIQTESYC
jgi:hypothetical protein